ncbi:MAG: hypothetical protein E7647_06230 [Ruminococcaceae bacterium]|nr:hypothetical protein [Oscillospiraceae bacterium]
MNIYYKQLMDFKGADELRELIKRWDILSDNIKKRSFDSPIVLPDLFVYTCPGYGNTNLISLLADYLDSKGNLMSFYGDVKYFEFRLDYFRPDQDFSDLYRLIESAESCAGFRNEFRGIIRINIDEWVGHHKEKHFLDFLQFLQVNTAHWLILLTLSDHSENDQTREMESVVSMYLRIEKLTLHMPSDVDLVEYASDYISKFGLEFSEDAKTVLAESVNVMRSNKYFYGLHTVTDLCNDIVYSLFSRSADVGSVITKDMLADFSADSEYIKRTVIKIKKTATIGF